MLATTATVDQIPCLHYLAPDEEMTKMYVPFLFQADRSARFASMSMETRSGSTIFTSFRSEMESMNIIKSENGLKGKLLHVYVRIRG